MIPAVAGTTATLCVLGSLYWFLNQMDPPLLSLRRISPPPPVVASSKNPVYQTAETAVPVETAPAALIPTAVSEETPAIVPEIDPGSVVRVPVPSVIGRGAAVALPSISIPVGGMVATPQGFPAAPMNLPPPPSLSPPPAQPPGARSGTQLVQLPSLSAPPPPPFDNVVREAPGAAAAPRADAKSSKAPAAPPPSTQVGFKAAPHGKKGLSQPAEWWGYRCRITAERTLISKDPAHWNLFRTKFTMPPDWAPEPESRDPRLRTPPEPLPDVDFRKMMVVGVFAGRVSQGFRIKIHRIVADPTGKTLRVEYGRSLPLPNPMKGGGVCEPYDMMVIPRFEGKVIFVGAPAG